MSQVIPITCLLVSSIVGSAFAQGTPPMQGSPMSARPDPNLKALPPDAQVKAITYCRATYRVTTADGETREFPERNLRFKTDAGPDGPERGVPAILPAGMVGDRASVIVAVPEEISTVIKIQC
jgi:cytochrome c